ncbi:hypothetical protein HN419_04460 [Candidatus Woesearchaeota archaeon]|nr:hypothetical protein [Candidatus Woesearchaeota archaeon]MBT3537869.1 hypothetical protein [Candidatus Woesearchaeota archaeon]MBT4698000.1 hypothetical protein [Candidatus Woesearchaeota archaeon]MBT4717659.1 hypothetical protein [Candidatus Woesearchaeota archaeon]MBT7105538.1 hypothetical protein [Candidatus Woesearchaeota archaeon]
MNVGTLDALLATVVVAGLVVSCGANSDEPAKPKAGIHTPAIQMHVAAAMMGDLQTCLPYAIQKVVPGYKPGPGSFSRLSREQMHRIREESRNCQHPPRYAQQQRRYDRNR